MTPWLLLTPLVLPWLAAGALVAARRRSAAVVAGLAWSLGAAEVGALFLLVAAAARHPLVWSAYLRADALSAFFLLTTALVFGLVMMYAAGYMRHVPPERFASLPWFYALLFLFLGTIVGVYLAANLGLMWILMEATTLASVLLVGFYNTERAVEAGWKYLIVCTVGLALGLFGTIAFYLAAVHGGIDSSQALDWSTLLQHAARLAQTPRLLQLGWVFVAVGYGTKVGLAPMHSWLPDAHAEAPSPVSAMLSAALLNCALYALIRFHQITARALGSGYSHAILLTLGLLSVGVGAMLMLVQRDLKRLFAYSSIEHMGIIATGLGLGGAWGVYGALFQVLNHAMAKCLMFFAAGSVRERYRESRMDKIYGLGTVMPLTAGALVLGGVALAGLPPFGLFVSEFAILRQAFVSHAWIGLLLLALLSVVFAALVRHTQPMVGGRPATPPDGPRASWGGLLAMALCLALLLLFGLHLPAFLVHLLRGAVAVIRS
jgi:hydrogenase-4 component F